MSEWSFWKNEYSTEANRIGVENAYTNDFFTNSIFIYN